MNYAYKWQFLAIIFVITLILVILTIIGMWIWVKTENIRKNIHHNLMIDVRHIKRFLGVK